MRGTWQTTSGGDGFKTAALVAALLTGIGCFRYLGNRPDDGEGGRQ